MTAEFSATLADTRRLSTNFISALSRSKAGDAPRNDEAGIRMVKMAPHASHARWTWPLTHTPHDHDHRNLCAPGYPHTLRSTHRRLTKHFLDVHHHNPPTQ